MDIETPIAATTEQLPQIRRITKLEDVRRVIPPKPVIPPRKEIKPIEKPRLSIRFFITGILFFVILGTSFAIIYRYDKLYKHLYQISVKLKDRIYILQDRLKYSNNIRNRLYTSRIDLIRNYFNLGSRYKILQFKMGEYRDAASKLSLARVSKIGLLEGNLRVAYANVEAVKVQNEVLTKELMKRDEYIRELTSKIINSIGEQELLVAEKLQLKEEIETLKSQVEASRQSGVEVKDVNQ